LSIEFIRKRKWSSSLKPELLILAGDIGLLGKKQTWFGFLLQCSKQFRDVFIIEGNHEWYHYKALLLVTGTTS
jgi:hypothetical protein